MKKNLTDILVILDESGSMESLKTDVVGAFNNFIGEQKKVNGECYVTLVTFDYGPFITNGYKVIYDRVDINHIKALDLSNYCPRGSTALIDSSCHAIDKLGERFTNLAEHERPERVIVVIQSDGYENASTKYQNDDLKQRITHQKDNYNWQFVFLGAGIDSFSVASNIGIDLNKTMSFNSSAKGYARSYHSTSNLVGTLRSCAVNDMNAVGFDNKDREDAVAN